MPDDSLARETLQARCCIVGGGPAGMVLGFLLARAGVDVVVLEKHGDFLRDFRGDTIHPSTLEVMHELGLLDEFLKRPHQEARELRRVSSATSRSRSPTSRTCRPTASSSPSCRSGTSSTSSPSTPGAIPTFHLRMQAEVDRPDRGGRPGRRGAGDDRRAGRSRSGPTLTVGADGRHSTVREPGRPGGRGPRGADRRPLDADLPRPERPRRSRSAGSTAGGSSS